MREITDQMLLTATLSSDLLSNDSQAESMFVGFHDTEERTFEVRVNFLDGSFQEFELFYNVGLTGDIREMYFCDDEDRFEQDDEWEDDGDMDGDFDSAMASAGYGTDEDYGYYGEDY